MKPHDPNDPETRACIFFPLKRNENGTHFVARSKKGIWIACVMRPEEGTSEVLQWEGEDGHQPPLRTRGRFYTCGMSPESLNDAYQARHGHLLRFSHVKQLAELKKPPRYRSAMNVKIILADGRLSIWENQYQPNWQLHSTCLSVQDGPTLHFDPVNLAALPWLAQGQVQRITSATKEDIMIGQGQLKYRDHCLPLQFSPSQAERLSRLQTALFRGPSTDPK